MKRTTKHVALDVHQATTVGSVREESGRVIARSRNHRGQPELARRPRAAQLFACVPCRTRTPHLADRGNVEDVSSELGDRPVGCRDDGADGADVGIILLSIDIRGPAVPGSFPECSASL